MNELDRISCSIKFQSSPLSTTLHSCSLLQCFDFAFAQLVQHFCNGFVNNHKQIPGQCDSCKMRCINSSDFTQNVPFSNKHGTSRYMYITKKHRYGLHQMMQIRTNKTHMHYLYTFILIVNITLLSLRYKYFAFLINIYIHGIRSQLTSYAMIYLINICFGTIIQ